MGNSRIEALPGSARIVLWLATATITGAIIMSMELAAFRLYAPYFGYSIFVWGSMISVVMAALAGGYTLGGWLADTCRSEVVLYSVILATGIYQLVVVFIARSVLVWLWQSGDFVGPVIATCIIFVPPMTGLAATSPFVIRLLAPTERIGFAAGGVFTLSTAGSIAGILTTSFYLVPHFGTRSTLKLLCALSILLGTIGLATRKMRAAVSALLLTPLFFVPKPTFPPAVVWTTESAYNWVAVLRKEGLQWLVLNDPHYSQTIHKIGENRSGYYFDEFALGPLLVPARRVLVLGMGGGATIQVTRALAPTAQIDAVEIDPKVVEVAVNFFGLHTDDPNLHVYVADARPWLALHQTVYDIVHVDLYQGGPYVPFYLATQEFFRLVRDRMSDDGVLIVNVYDLTKNRELLQATGATLKCVFASLAVVSRPDGNHVVFAFPHKRPANGIAESLRAAKDPAWIQLTAHAAASSIVDFEPPAGTAIFTDDRAPIEEMTRRMLLAGQK